VYPLSRQMVVKTGSDVRLDEAATMMFVKNYTNIPVPKVLSAFIRDGAAYIVMEKIPGQELAKAWHRLSDQARASLLGQLREHLDQLRALPPPTEFSVGSCIGGSLQDFRQSCRPPPVQFGPFRTIQDFHSWLRNGLKQGEATGMEPAELDKLNEMIAKQDGPWPPPVFTHGDLNPSNILVRDDKIVGIIDWEMAGWYPHYWEYTSLKMASDLVNPVWHENIEKFLSPLPDELKMEQVRFRWWGNIC
jgi:aminoglycoside phosphotransferase (APT) family kinase protein